MKRFLPRWSAPLTLLWACLLAFGLAIPWLGLYADDWPFVYVNHLAGLRGVVDFISWVRPVAAWVFAATAALGGTHFWVYHLLLLLLRWLAALLFWLLLRRCWPRADRLALWAALLFAVYPAFKQQPLALEYTPHFLALALIFGSFWINLRLTDAPPLSPTRRRSLAVLAWLGAFQVFILEYFAGLELLRPVLLWLHLKPRLGSRAAAKKALRLWLPYLPVLAGFLFWRVFILKFPSYQPGLLSDLRSAPLHALLTLAKTVLHDVFTAGLAAWVQPFAIPVGGRSALAWAGVVLLALVSLGAALIWIGRRSPSGAEPGSTPAAAAGLHASGVNYIPSAAGPHASGVNYGLSAAEFTLLGLFALLCAGGPFWVTQIPLTLDFPWDRASLAFMTGACLLIAGLLGLFEDLICRVLWIRDRPRRTLFQPSGLTAAALIAPLLVALLAATSIGLHFQNANAFRRESSLVTSFFWQLAWRAPGLEPGTAIVLDQTPFNYHVDKFLSPALNWTYASDNQRLQTPYALLDFYKQWGKTLPPKTATDPVSTQYGTLRFDSDTAHLLMVVYDPPGCLRVLTPDDETRLATSPELQKVLPLTNLSLIQPAPAHPAQPPGFIGAEPAHDWCYYFEKAELAARSGDPASAIALYDQARAANLQPRRPTELLTFLDAYAQLGRWDEARQLGQTIAASGDSATRATCAAWDSVGRSGQKEQAAQAKKALGCP